LNVLINLGIIIIFSGFFYGAAVPFFYEFSIELTYPVNSTVSTSILVIWINICATAFMFVCDYVPSIYITPMLAIVSLFCCMLLVFIKEEYHRADYDEKHEDHHLQIISNFDISVNNRKDIQLSEITPLK
jgi:hypothetical protein